MSVNSFFITQLVNGAHLFLDLPCANGLTRACTTLPPRPEDVPVSLVLYESVCDTGDERFVLRRSSELQ